MTVTQIADRDQYVRVPLEMVSESTHEVTEIASSVLHQDHSNSSSLCGRVNVTSDIVKGALCITVIVLLLLGFVLMIAGGEKKNAAIMWSGAGVMVVSLPAFAYLRYISEPRIKF